MNYYLKILFILIIDFLFFWIWFQYEDPDPSVSIGIVLIVPVVIVINLIIAGIIKLLKFNFLPKLFLLNSIFAPVIASILWTNAIKRHQSRIWEIWSFTHNGKNYQIDLYKPDNTFDLIYRPKNRPSTDLVASGKIKKIENRIVLTNDTKKFEIKNDTLYGFMNEKIKLNKN